MAGTEDPNTDPGGPSEVQEPGGQPVPSPGTPVESPSSPPEGPAPAPSDASTTAPKEEATPPKPVTDWRDRRIGELTQRTRELRAEIERLRGASGANGQAPGAAPSGDARGANGRFQAPAGYQGPPDQALIDQQVQQRAQILADTQEFNRRCNEVAEVGRRTYTDFDANVANLVGLVDPGDPQGVAAYNEFLNAALETGEASKLLHALGGDLNEASRILSLSPRRMAVELTRMAARPIQELSGAPRPINPAATNAQVQRTSVSPDNPGSDNMSTAEWMRQREAQIAARNVRR